MTTMTYWVCAGAASGMVSSGGREAVGAHEFCAVHSRTIVGVDADATAGATQLVEHYRLNLGGFLELNHKGGHVFEEPTPSLQRRIPCPTSSWQRYRQRPWQGPCHRWRRRGKSPRRVMPSISGGVAGGRSFCRRGLLGFRGGRLRGRRALRRGRCTTGQEATQIGHRKHESDHQDSCEKAAYQPAQGTRFLLRSLVFVNFLVLVIVRNS